MKFCVYFFGAIIFGASFSGHSHADVYNYTEGQNVVLFEPQSMILTDFDKNRWHQFASVALEETNQFDPMFGTLNSVTLTLNGTIDVFASFADNGMPGTGSETAVVTDLMSHLSFGIPSGNPDNPIKTLDSDFFNVTSVSTYGIDDTIFDLAEMSLMAEITGSDLDFFIGTGYLEDISVTSFLSYRNFDGFPDSMEMHVDTIFDGVAEVDYNYSVASAVPIPGAVWLLGTGILGLGFIRRKKN